MKTLLSVFRIMLLAVLPVCISCGRLGEDDGGGAGATLGVCFSNGSELLTRSFVNIPDTSEFRLKVTKSTGESIYEGAYGDCPEVLDVSPGSYTVTIRSSEFNKPAFDMPVFGDEQCVVVKSGCHVAVSLICTQINAGVRLDISKEFKSSYADAVLFLKSSSGSLMYSVSEKRTAYFMPGPVSLMMSRGAQDNILMVKDMRPCDMLIMKVLAPSVETETSGGISVAVDTSRVWVNEECVVGESTPAEDVLSALTIADARKAVGQKDVWVTGYIVGGDLTSASAAFYGPFKSMTNILLGPRSAVSDKSACLSVQLPDNGVRESLNLVEHPQMLGRRISVKGDVVASYFGICGIKNTVEYVLH